MCLIEAQRTNINIIHNFLTTADEIIGQQVHLGHHLFHVLIPFMVF